MEMSENELKKIFGIQCYNTVSSSMNITNTQTHKPAHVIKQWFLIPGGPYE